MVRDFAATDALDDAGVRALLAGGAAEERVWAAWRIAIRRGSAMPEIVAQVRGEPSPGVRRALVVVLAGHGELDLLVALGRHDPAAEVRAAAMTIVARVAGQGAIDPAVVTDAFAADAGVRPAILGGIPAGAPGPLRELILRGLVDPGHPHEVRLEAFEAALRLGAYAAAVRWLVAAGGALSDAACERLLALDAGAVREILAGAEARVRAQLRTRLVRRASESNAARRLVSLIDRGRA
jgi:hypothetical protein